MIDNPVQAVRMALNLSLFGMARKLKITAHAVRECEQENRLPANAESRALLHQLARQAGLDWNESAGPHG